MSSKERLSGRSWEEWEFELKGKAIGTQKNSLRGIKKFLDHYDLTTEELFEMHRVNLKSDDPRDGKKVPKMAVRLVHEYIDNRGLRPSSAMNILNSVRSFFKANMLPFVVNGNLPDLDKRGKERMTREQIKMLLDATGSYRNKSIITMAKDTGLRCCDIAEIRVKHILPIIEERKDFHTFTIKQQKTKLNASPVCGKDAVKYLRLWWKDRAKYNLSVDPEAYLYCMVETVAGYVRTSGKAVSEVKAGDPLRPQAISNMVYNLIRKAGLDKKNISAHSLRKFHETALQAGRVPDPWIDKTTGRKTPGSKGVYTKPSEEQLLQYYKEAYEFLSLEQEQVTAEEIRRIEGELEILKQNQFELSEQNREYQRLFAEVLADGEVKQKAFEKLAEISLNPPRFTPTGKTRRKRY